MTAGDVTITEVNDFTATTLDTALTSVRSAIGLNGTWQVVIYGNDAFVIGIEEAV
jgi:hypothetical protein